MDSRQAEAIVAAISLSDAELATKADLEAEVFRALWTQGAGLVGIQLPSPDYSLQLSGFWTSCLLFFQSPCEVS